MVSTRSSLAPDEPMESLDMSKSTRRMTRSPSPRKRKAEEETPEQSFVDARATPFTQRKRSESHGSIDTPIQRTRVSQLAQDSDDHSEDSDDEAPEAITNATTAKAAQDLERVRQEDTKKRADAAREKRRRRDELLRAQRQASKAVQEQQKESLLDDMVSENESVSDEETNVKPKRQVIPRMLPDDILNAPIPTTISSRVDSDIVKGTHIKFEPKKEITRMQKGPLMVQLLKKQRRDMAPKQSASVANTRNQWLYQRGSNSVNRRPIKKPLA